MNKRKVALGPGAASLILIVVVLALCMMAMLTQISARNDYNLCSRSAVWAEDGGEVRIEHFDDLGITALCVVNNFDGEIYYKRLYCAVDEDPLDGEPRSYLWESYTSEDTEFRVESGETLCELNSFVPSIDGQMLTAEMEASDGTKSTIHVSLRAGGAKE